MYVVRGSLPTADSDRAVTARLADIVEETGDPVLRAWTPPKQVAFGRRDAAAEGYERAREAAVERGYEPIERSVGGHAVAYTGETVAFCYAVGTDDERNGIESRYQETTSLLQRAFRSVGLPLDEGEPADSFCPGDHSLQRNGKIVGIAQRVRRTSAVVGGYVIVTRSDEREIADVLDPIYAALDVSFDPDSVGSVEGAGGPGVPDAIIDAIETTFLEGREATVRDAATLADGTP